MNFDPSCSFIAQYFVYNQPISQLRFAFLKNLSINNHASIPEKHSHPRSAAQRREVERSLIDLISNEGYDPYVISTSERDKEFAGYHRYHTARDFAYKPKGYDVIVKTDFTERHVGVMIDVDYYMDVNKWMAKGRAYMMYTTIPEHAAGQLAEGAYWFENNELVTKVVNASEYRHQLWDYNQDHYISKGFLKRYVYTCDKIDLGQSRKIVALIPSQKLYAPFCWFVKPIKVQRLTPTLKASKGMPDTLDVNVIKSLTAVNVPTKVQDKVVGSHKEYKVMVSVAFKQTGFTATIPAELFDSLLVRYDKTDKPTIATCEQLLRSQGIEAGEAALKATVLFQALENAISVKSGKHQILTQGVPYEVYAKDGRHTYQTYATAGVREPLFTEDGKVIGRVICSPLVTNPDLMPRESYNNDSASVAGRVEAVRNSKVPPRRYYEYARQYVAEIVPVPGQGIADGFDEVLANQKTKMQKLRAKEVINYMVKCKSKVRAFMKHEATKPGAFPRNISQTPTQTMLAASTYTYAFKRDVMKPLKWYLPGQTPKQIVATVLAKLGTTDIVVQATDFSKFDGTISPFLRIFVERAAYLRWVHDSQRRELSDLLYSDATCTGITRNGVKYTPAYGRLSGSAFTTDGNSLINGYIAYCAQREFGCNHKEAFERIIGIAGDDGLIFSTGDKAESAAEACGLSLKCEEIKPGNPVPLLGRFLINPWLTDNSCQDIERTLRKIHLTKTGDDIPIGVARYNKADGYQAADKYTPLIGTWVKNVISNANDADRNYVTNAHQRQILEDDLTFWRAESENEAWPNKPDAKFLELAAKQFNCSVEDIIQFDNRIRDCVGLDFPKIENTVEDRKVISTVHGDYISSSGDTEIKVIEITEQHGKNLLLREIEKFNDQQSEDGSSTGCGSVDSSPGSDVDRCSETGISEKGISSCGDAPSGRGDDNTGLGGCVSPAAGASQDGDTNVAERPGNQIVTATVEVARGVVESPIAGEDAAPRSTSVETAGPGTPVLGGPGSACNVNKTNDSGPTGSGRADTNGSNDKAETGKTNAKAKKQKPKQSKHSGKTGDASPAGDGATPTSGVTEHPKTAQPAAQTNGSQASSSSEAERRRAIKREKNKRQNERKRQLLRDARDKLKSSGAGVDIASGAGEAAKQRTGFWPAESGPGDTADGVTATGDKQGAPNATAIGPHARGGATTQHGYGPNQRAGQNGDRTRYNYKAQTYQNGGYYARGPPIFDVRDVFNPGPNGSYRNARGGRVSYRDNAPRSTVVNNWRPDSQGWRSDDWGGAAGSPIYNPPGYHAIPRHRGAFRGGHY